MLTHNVRLDTRKDGATKRNPTNNAQSKKIAGRTSCILALVLGCLLGLIPTGRAGDANVAEKVIVDKSTFEPVKGFSRFPQGATSIPDPFYWLKFSLGIRKHTPKADDPTDHGYSIYSSVGGRLAFVHELYNFRMRLWAAGTPEIMFRYWDNGNCYGLDPKSGVLTKTVDGERHELAKASSPIFAVDEKTGKMVGAMFIEIIAQDQQIVIRCSPDGQKDWRTVIDCQDPKPLGSGVIVLGSTDGHRGNISYGSITIVSRSSDREAAEPKMSAEDLAKKMKSLVVSAGKGRRPPELQRLQQEVLRELVRHSPPFHPDVPLILAMVMMHQVGNQDIDDFRFTALRVATRLKLKIDAREQLIRGLTHQDWIVQSAAVWRLLALKPQITAEELAPRVVDMLLMDTHWNRGAAIHLKERATAKLICEEIDRRLAAAGKDAPLRARLMRALETEHGGTPMLEAVPILLKGLDDSAPEVRLSSLHTLRYFEYALRWQEKQNVFQKNPELATQVGDKMREILEKDPSVPCRVEAVGCLAELRESAPLLIAALDDKEPEVRRQAAQVMCFYKADELQAAIPKLKGLVDDPRCGKDAAASLAFILDHPSAWKGKKPPVDLSGIKTMSPDEAIKATRQAFATMGRGRTLKSHAWQVPFLWDVMSHASAQLCLGLNRDGANERIQRYTGKFVWGQGVGLTYAAIYHSVYAMHYSKSRLHPGQFTKETEDLQKEMFFSIVDWGSLQYDYLSSNPEFVFGSENIMLCYNFGSWYLSLGYLQEDPRYADRVLRSGKTVKEHYEQWNDFMKKWLRYRALNGMWIELGANYLNNYTMPMLQAIYLGGADPEVRKLAEMLLDLTFIDDAQCSFGNIRGGGKSRNKQQGIYGSLTRYSQPFYEGKTIGGKSAHLISACGYEPPDVAILLRNYEQYPEKPIEIINRRIGETPEELNVCAANSRAVNYMWKTRHYMLGGSIRLPKAKFIAMYVQMQWNGLIFANGSGLYPVSYWSYLFQHKNVMIVQRLTENDFQFWTGAMQERVDKDGYAFINCDGNAYAALRPASGGFKWADKKGQRHTGGMGGRIPAGTFLIPDEQDTPVLIHAGDVDEYGSFEGFMEAVLAKKLELREDRVVYSGPGQDEIEFFLHDTGKPPHVNGTPFQYLREMVYDSPFMQRKEGENVVTVRVGDRTAVYDFDKAHVVTTEGFEPDGIRVPKKFGEFGLEPADSPPPVSTTDRDNARPGAPADGIHDL